jgi:hypothetical protein
MQNLIDDVHSLMPSLILNYKKQGNLNKRHQKKVTLNDTELHLRINSGVYNENPSILRKNSREGVPWLEDTEASHQKL